MANGAWGYAQAREIREGSRELPRVTKAERDEALAVREALESRDDEADEAAWERAFNESFDRYAEWVARGRPEGGF